MHIIIKSGTCRETVGICPCVQEGRLVLLTDNIPCIKRNSELLVVPFIHSSGHVAGHLGAGVEVAVVLRDQVHVMEDEALDVPQTQRLHRPDVQQHAAIERRRLSLRSQSRKTLQSGVTVKENTAVWSHNHGKHCSLGSHSRKTLQSGVKVEGKHYSLVSQSKENTLLSRVTVKGKHTVVWGHSRGKTHYSLG